MKTFFLALTLISSISIFANETNVGPQLCWTHGQCQTSMPTPGSKCYIIKTGTSGDGSVTCSLRCYTLPMGSTCEQVPGYGFGVCKTESYTVPKFDPNDCSSAIDPI